MHRILEVLDIIDRTDNDTATKIAFCRQSVEIVRSYNASTTKQSLLREDLLSNYLDLVSKDLSNLQSNINSYKFAGVALNCNMELLEAVKLGVPCNLISYRGMYLCINFIEALRLNDEYYRCRALIARYISELEGIGSRFGSSFKDLMPYFRKYTTDKPSCEEDGHLSYELTPQTHYWLLFG